MKKGFISTSTFVWLLGRFPLLIASFIATYVIIDAYTMVNIDIADAEIEIFSKGLLNNLYHKDELTGRVVIGLIDPYKLFPEYEENLQEQIKYPENKFIAAKLTFKTKEELIFYFSKNWYENWKPIAEAKKKGEKVKSKTFILPVLISDKNEFEIARLQHIIRSLGSDPNPDTLKQLNAQIEAVKKNGKGESFKTLLILDVVRPV